MTFIKAILSPTLLLSVFLLATITSCSEPERPVLSKAEKDRRGREAAIMLIDSLGDSQSDVQWIAVENLVMIGEPALEPLLDAIVSNNPFIRRRAAEALGRLRNERAVLPLIKTLSDEVAQVRISAAFGLALLKDDRAIEPLLKVLNNDSKNVSKMAAMSLVQITGESHGLDIDKWNKWHAEKKASK